jgi:hypothetical protein
MATYTQDYLALPDSTEAAVIHARAVASKHQPDRVDDIETVVRALFTDALARTSPGGNINLITIVEPGVIRFEIHDSNTPLPGIVVNRDVQRLVSEKADRYGSSGTRAGHMAWAELRTWQAVAS